MNEYNEKVIKDALNLRREEEDAEFLKEIQQANNNPDFKMKKMKQSGLLKRFLKLKITDRCSVRLQLFLWLPPALWL